MAREQLAAGERAHGEIVKLHKSIPADASSWDLFTFAERKFWGILRHRKR
jgi:hypothetical protein